METIQGTKDDDILVGTAEDEAIIGNKGDDILLGGAGDDVVQGNQGDDVLMGGSGDDNVHGGHGDDIAIYLVAANVDSEDRYYGGNGTDTLRIVLSSEATPEIQADLDRFQQFLDDGGHGTFSFVAFDLTVQGFETLDVVVTAPLFTEMADTVDFNTVIAGTYVDGTQYDALGGDDIVILPADAAAAAASGYAVGTAFNGGGGSDTIIGGTLDDEVNGGAGDDTLYGGSGDDILRGGGGGDSLFGGDGDDLLGPGHNPGQTDYLDGGAGTDTASFRDAPVDVQADLETGIATRGTATAEMSNIENINGSDNNDDLRGDAGDNVLRGFDGDDTLVGRGGDDDLFGGDGNDTFVFNDGDGSDMIHGFVAGMGTDDVIDFSAIGTLDSFADVQAAIAQVGANTVIDLGGGNDITLIGVNIGDLHPDDFMF